MTLLCIAALCLTATVTDGDTLRAGGQGHRIWGIDSVERGTPGWRAAKHAMRALTDGQTLECTYIDTDRHKRLVVRCTLPDGRDLACEMVRLGQAEDWHKYSKGAYAGCGG